MHQDSLRLPSIHPFIDHLHKCITHFQGHNLQFLGTLITPNNLTDAENGELTRAILHVDEVVVEGVQDEGYLLDLLVVEVEEFEGRPFGYLEMIAHCGEGDGASLNSV